MFELKHKDGARTGILKTLHCKVETPFFMPVATKTAVKYVDIEDLEEIGVQSIISNSFILSLRPGLDVIKKAGGIHKFMNFKNCIFTDSGGFQKIKKSFEVKCTHDGIEFKSPFDGKKHLLTPKKAVEIQETIGSDVAMILDDMPLHGHSKERVALAVERTHRWSQEFLKYHTSKKQLVFGIAQGGIYKDLREKSATFIGNLDFDGFAFGGLAIGESSEEMYKMINMQVKHFPEDKVRYLMGVGSPKEMVNAIAAGVDCFDSTFPTQNARHGTLFTSQGKLRIMQSKYTNDTKPIDKECDCYICKNHSRAYIRYLLKMGEPNGLHYATYHNIYFLTHLMKKIRTSIKENSFEKFRRSFVKKFK